MPPAPPLMRSLIRSGLRLAAILALAYGIHLLIGWAMKTSEVVTTPAMAMMVTSLLVLLLFAYALLIAVPFVPGIEIGLTLIILRGASIAPYVYLATVAGLTLAYLIGRYLPYGWLHRALIDLRLTRAAELLASLQPLSTARRLALLRKRLPDRLGPYLINWRYPLLALLINLPGTMIIGGGGGICLVAGLTRIFTPRATLLTIAIAVLPVPFGVWFFGVDYFWRPAI